MNAEEWKPFATEMVNGLERRLCISAPKKARAQLRQMRDDVNRARTSRLRKRWERKLDALVESAPWFRAAAKRYLSPLVKETLLDALRTLKRANLVLRKAAHQRPSTDQLPLESVVVKFEIANSSNWVQLAWFMGYWSHA